MDDQQNEVSVSDLITDTQDKILICASCGSDFKFEKGEQDFARKMVSEGKWSQYVEPKRCKPCRIKKSKEIADRRYSKINSSQRPTNYR